MSLLTEAQLAQITAQMNLFQPSGFNDDRRVDQSQGAPFLAIDTASPHERDDAIRTRRLRDNGGFLVQTAFADGSQIPYPSEAVTEAMRAKASTYRGKRVVETMLSEVAVRKLELSPNRNPQRALVVENEYDNYGQPKRTADVYPAWVTIESINFGGLAGRYLLGKEGLNHPMAKFHEAFRSNRPDLPTGIPVALGGDKPNVMYGSDVNQDFMIISNLGITDVAMQRRIPLLHRRFPSVEAIWSQNGQVASDRGHYLLCGNVEFADDYIPYARASSPMREGVSLANHLLFGAFIAGQSEDYIESMAVDLLEQFEA